jgi:hypothetical protein
LPNKKEKTGPGAIVPLNLSGDFQPHAVLPVDGMFKGTYWMFDLISRVTQTEW